MKITNISREDLIDILKQIYRCIPESFPHEKRRNWEQVEHGLRKLIDFFEENAKLTESNDLYAGDEKIFDTAELNLMADEYGVDEEEIESNYHDYIDAFVETIYDNISN